MPPRVPGDDVRGRPRRGQWGTSAVVGRRPVLRGHDDRRQRDGASGGQSAACPPSSRRCEEMVGTTRCAFAHPTHFCHTFALSRRIASEFFQSIRPHRKQRAQGMPGAGCTHGPRATKSTRQNHRFSRSSRHSLRNGFNGLLRALPGETGLCCHRRFASSCKTRHLHRGARTTRLRRPRHVVRQTTHRVHRIPLPTSVTIAKRPSCGSETRK